MKPLRSYILTESFKSSQIRELADYKNDWIKTYGYYMLAWDKIQDSDIVRYDNLDDALKIMRMRKGAAHYMIWVTSSYNYKTDSYLFAPYLMTLGTDLVWSDYRAKGSSTTAMVNSRQFKYALEILDWQKFSVSDLRQQRRDNKFGATALKDNLSIARENKEKYKQLLAQIHNIDEEQKIRNMFDSSMEMYQNVIVEWSKHIANIVQEESPSWYKSVHTLNAINKTMADICANLNDFDSYKKRYPEWAQESAKKLNQSVDELKQLAEQILDNNRE